MNKQKLSYTAPVAETFVVQAEGVICGSIINAIHAIQATEYFTSGSLDDDYEEL